MMAFAIAAAGAVLAVALGLLYVRSSLLERRFSYFPSPTLSNTPTDVGVPFEDVWLEAADGVALHGWFSPGERDVTFLWLHGNGGNISFHLEHLRDIRRNLGVGVFLPDYRGYGLSRGTPSEFGLYRDAAAALAYLHARPGVRADRIVYFGQSLGTAVAVELATHEAPLGLVLEAPFPSGTYMARRSIRLPGWFYRLFVPSRFDTLSRIGDIRAPLLVVHGDQDTTVPYAAGQIVFEAAVGPKEMFTVSGGAHVDSHSVGGDAYYAALRRFIDGLT